MWCIFTKKKLTLSKKSNVWTSNNFPSVFRNILPPYTSLWVLHEYYHVEWCWYIKMKVLPRNCPWKKNIHSMLLLDTILKITVFIAAFSYNLDFFLHFVSFSAPHLVKISYMCIFKTSSEAFSLSSFSARGNTYIHISPVTISAPSCQVCRSAPLHTILSFSILCMKWDESPRQKGLTAALENNETGFR